MGKHAGFGGKTLEQAVDAVMSAPLTYVSPAPPGVVMFDASNTTRSVRMVVQHLGDPTSAVYVAECTPYTLESGVLYEVRIGWRAEGFSQLLSSALLLFVIIHMTAVPCIDRLVPEVQGFAFDSLFLGSSL